MLRRRQTLPNHPQAKAFPSEGKALALKKMPPAGWQGNTTYTALFRAQSYTLTLDDNGGTGYE